jgi:flagellum-specific ATP synthase
LSAGASPTDLVGDCGRFLDRCREFLAPSRPYAIRGRLTRASGLVMEAVGLKLPVGATCEIVQDGRIVTEAEVVGFAGERLFLMPINDVQGLSPGAVVRPTASLAPPPKFGELTHPWRRATDLGKRLPVGWRLLGRVVDAAGRPLDGRGELCHDAMAPLQARPYNPIERDPVRHVLDVGVRSINALLSVGRGQRLGIFAGSGVGKSVLLAMMARFTTADVIVVGLIGERGREVKEFVEDILGVDGLARACVVAAPADLPPLLRMQGAAYATAIAEHFRNEGRHVLLIMDSLTRYAMAQREIALAINEPPATKGYPPSVFAKLPQLVERTGNARPGGGSITAFYTVLTEGDDQQDPIADSARAILDGHFVLSRRLADAGHYPAIDIGASVSRVMPSIVSADDLAAARMFRSLYTTYERNRDLFPVGAYQHGHDAVLDQAVALHPRMSAFLQQGMDERSDCVQSRARLYATLDLELPVAGVVAR